MDEEQNDIVPSFTELGMKDYDKTNDIIRFYYFFKRQEECHDMSHNNLDTWIIRQLASFAYNKLQESDNSITDNYIKYQYHYNAQHTVLEIIHGNTGHTSIRSDCAIIDDNIKQDINNYLHNYANIYGFLSLDITYTSVYEAYISTIKSNKEDNYKPIAYTTFTQIWHEVAPDIRFMTKASDLYDRCEQLHIKI
ncbi:27_t:CDS:2 [Cetraspora pellucida]|uniref:27_t:CDS:1 n=1 Tax=Cetraspora pellucida TaxID=1433469 RepID=A0A9N8ZLT1_9GLOM|nr:27_t:CDS:2 [Cetraspora pellucida]